MTVRERFERWMKRMQPDADLRREGTGYFYTGVREAWLAWNASRRLR